MSLYSCIAIGIAVLISLCSIVPVQAADEPTIVAVWPGAVPGDDAGAIGPEKFRTLEESPTKDAKWLTNVTKPTITIFRPPKDKSTGAAVLICPGGGYWNLAWDLEGTELAEWLNSIGITGIVLKYRVPRRPGQPGAVPPPGPLQDAQRAVSLVRSKAKEWEIDSNRIGMVGFSAGGHLVIATATSFDKRTYTPIDSIDSVSCRPDFVIAAYSGYLNEQKSGAVAAAMHIPHDTCPVMLVHASDDTIAGAENSVGMYEALRSAGIPAELHVYASGEHGFGVRKSPKAVSTWTDRCIDWLKSLGVLRHEHN
jgi:acetyl esterase/lipase